MHVKEVQVKSAFVIKPLTVFISCLSPNTCPSSYSTSCWFWEGRDLFKLKGKRHEGPSGGAVAAERNGEEGFQGAPHRQSRLGTGRQTLQATL